MTEKYINSDRHGDRLEVIVRDSSFKKIFQKEVNTSDKELEILLKDLKNKGIDLIRIIRRKMIEDSGWFD